MTEDTLKIILAVGVPVGSVFGGLLANAIRAVWKHLVEDARTARQEAREAREDIDAMKEGRKREARALRLFRIEDERFRHGRASIQPPQEEETTAVYETMRAEDMEYLEREREALNERMRRYVADESTPPESFEPPRPRPRLKSRPGG